MQWYYVFMLRDLSSGFSLHYVFDEPLKAQETMKRGEEEGEIERMTSTGLTHTNIKSFTDVREQDNLPTPQALE